jgi:hypothetical protein
VLSATRLQLLLHDSLKDPGSNPSCFYFIFEPNNDMFKKSKNFNMGYGTFQLRGKEI